jgi:hypothetical protein
MNEIKWSVGGHGSDIYWYPICIVTSDIQNVLLSVKGENAIYTLGNTIFIWQRDNWWEQNSGCPVILVVNFTLFMALVQTTVVRSHVCILVGWCVYQWAWTGWTFTLCNKPTCWFQSKTLDSDWDEIYMLILLLTDWSLRLYQRWHFKYVRIPVPAALVQGPCLAVGLPDHRYHDYLLPRVTDPLLWVTPSQKWISVLFPGWTGDQEGAQTISGSIRHFGHIGINGRIILKWISQNWDVMACVQLA